jgi:hypothetical protein
MASDAVLWAVKVRRQTVANLADYRHVYKHPERRNTGCPASEGAKLSLRVIPIGEGIVAGQGNVNGALLEERFN